MIIKLTVTAINGKNLPTSYQKLFETKKMSSIDINKNTGSLPTAVTGNAEFSYKETDGIVWMYTVNESLSTILAIIDAGGELSNVGTVGDATVVAKESGNSAYHVTELTLTDFPVGNPTGSANLAFGKLLYTLPAGVLKVNVTKLDIALTSTGSTIEDDTPEIGIGTTLASGAHATLGAAGATTENIIEGSAVADLKGVVKSIWTVDRVLTRAQSDVKTVFLNLADGWAGADDGIKASGKITLEWVYYGSDV